MTELFTWTACYPIGLLTVLHLAFLFSNLVKDGCLLSKFTCNRIATMVKRRTQSCILLHLQSLSASSQSDLLRCHLWPQMGHISKAQCIQGGDFTKNCRLNNIKSQYDMAYHILMILQCPGPWWRQSQQGKNLTWRYLPSGGQIHSCSSQFSFQIKNSRDVSG